MDYQGIKDYLEIQKKKLINKLGTNNLSQEEYEALNKSIDNYEYILEITKMNHYERGISHEK